MSQVAIPFIDFSDEASTAVFEVADGITDGNITAIFNAIVGVTLGNAQKSVLRLATDKDTGTAGKPANAFAQRETKWLVQYTDAVTLKRFTREIPCADLAESVAGTDSMNLAGAAGLALVAALETHMLSPVGNAITINSVKHVGRST